MLQLHDERHRASEVEALLEKERSMAVKLEREMGALSDKARRGNSRSIRNAYKTP